MKKYRLTDEAIEELRAAVEFYNAHHPGLGNEFAIEVRRICRRVAEAPSLGTPVLPKIRRRLVRRFPYSVLYMADSQDVIVFAIAHQARRPGYWKPRS